MSAAEGGAGSGTPAFPQGMSIPVLPDAPQPVSGIEGGMQGAARVADALAGGVQVATQLAAHGGEGASAEQLVPGVLGGLGSALGGASSFASGIDPGVSQALGVVSSAASLVGGAAGLVRSVVDAIEGAVSEANRHRVTFAFESGALPDAQWLVASFTHEERIGRPFVTTVVLATEDLDLDPGAMLGVNARLTLRRGEDHERVIGGLVGRIELGRTTDRARVVTVELVPALALLGLTRDSRVFQDLDVLEILDAVLGGGLEGYSRVLEQHTRRHYWRREHCVQYGESDLDFAQRLMEEEGITYFFEWASDGTEKVVLVDGRDGMPALLPDDESIPFVEQRGETSDTEHVHELLAATQLRTTSFALTDLDWTQVRPAAAIEAHVHGQDPQGRSRERYDHDRAVTHGVYERKAYLESDAERRLATRREAHALEAHVLRGAGNVLRLAPGRTITIEEHPVATLDGELLVLAVSHRGHSPELRDLLGSAGYAADDVSYECSFEAIPAHVPYRMPEVTPKPRVHGMLSAIVTGGGGQEIHSDEHRRVRIQMRWDRQGTFDERSSALVRVMQSWAGSGFGTMFLPRVGMEVAVAFLDGDPDRPVIAGCLYNAECEPPYKTEAEWTKSGIRTRSSPDAGATHGNELTFDDAAGQEQILVHAQKDLDEHVEHDHTTHVERNQTNTVDADHTETIGGDQHLHVRQDRYARVDGIEEIYVESSRRIETGTDERRIVRGEQHETVVGKATLEHQAGRELHVRGEDRESFGGGRQTAVTGDDQSSATGNKLVYADGGIRLGAQSLHEIDLRDGVNVLSPAAVRIIVGSSVISVNDQGHVTIASTSRIALGCGAASITLSSDGTVDVSGPAGVNLTCGQSSVALSPMGVTTSGTTVSATAVADHTIVGAIVRIN